MILSEPQTHIFVLRGKTMMAVPQGSIFGHVAQYTTETHSMQRTAVCILNSK